MVMTADPQVEAEQDAGAEVAGGGAAGGGAAGDGAAGAEGVVGDSVEDIDDIPPPPQALSIASSTAAAGGKHRLEVALAVINCCAGCMDVSLLRGRSTHKCLLAAGLLPDKRRDTAKYRDNLTPRPRRGRDAQLVHTYRAGLR
jgi:hypothetical protein